MARYVALLRGVNVGGKNRLPMAALRELFVELGYEGVTTLIQSGNVVFSSEAPVRAEDLGAAIGRRFGIDTAVAVREGSALRRALDANPFAGVDPDRLHLGLLSSAPTPSAVAGLDASPFAPDRFAVVGAELYLDLPNGMARTKLPGYLDRRLRAHATIRNWRTATRLVALAEGA